MAKSNHRVHVDCAPCPAALQAIQATQDLYPDNNLQALIDRLVITGLSAMVHGRWEPPSLYGRDRDGWELPKALRPQKSA